ncbi:MAG: hypothetical protein ABI175_00435 [Polyangiales bacterium]
MSARPIVALLVVVLLACGKKDDAPPSPPAAASTTGSGAASASATGSGAATGAATGSGAATGAGAVTVVLGKYDAKLAAVRTPDDAPKFDDVAEGSLGAGEITLSLPAGDGEVTGTSSGALGAQVFRGQLEAGWLGGVLRAEGEGGMWGYLDATVTGAGDARVVTGTLRVSSGDGRVVRESAFTLAKK